LSEINMKPSNAAKSMSGVDVLAAGGLLDGKRAATHWSRSADFARRYPKVKVDADRIFIRQGRVWTAAGITSGIDLSLALTEEDLGETIARKTAQLLVVYYRRPGGQSQLSALLDLERPGGRFVELLDHIRSHLRRRHRTVELAEFVNMSPRNFFRAFLEETGMTPAKAVQRLRAEAARTALSSDRRSIQDVARSCGFGSADRMRRTFVRVLGTAPSVLRAQRRWVYVDFECCGWLFDWKKHSTWVAPSVFLQNVGNLGPLHLVEGHTRLGTLRGTLEHGLISAESLHSAWVGA
jgi:transcriptional regulator GlxA family with amidase domain